MNRVGDVEPDVPVDSPAFVPPALEMSRIDVHGQHVPSAVDGVGSDVVAKARVTAGVAAKVVAVDPDLAVPVNAVEVDPERFAAVRGGHVESQAIPAGGGGERAVVRIGLGAELPLHDVIVRQVHGAPGVIVIAPRRGARGCAPRLLQVHRLGNPARVGGVFDQDGQLVRPSLFPCRGEIDVERVVPAVVMEKATAVQEDRGVVVNAVEMQGMPWPFLMGQQRTIPDETNAAAKHIIAAGRVVPAGAAGIESRCGHLRVIALARVIGDPPPARDRRPLGRGRRAGSLTPVEPPACVQQDARPRRRLRRTDSGWSDGDKGEYTEQSGAGSYHGSTTV